MAIVFVHGFPLTSAAWNPLLDELSTLNYEEVVRLSPPGFGAPLPADFGATLDDYRNWLVDELSQLEEPADIVGHSWGGGYVAEVAMARPDLLRSWVSDTVGGYEPDFTWHTMAQTWQTSGDGERDVEEMLTGAADERAARMVEWGIPEPVASEVALAQRPEMGKAILALYRSAAPSVLIERGRNLPAAAALPGLVPIPTEDGTVGSVATRHRAAERAGARAVELDGIGHWWMLEDPAQVAHMLADFWKNL